MLSVRVDGQRLGAIGPYGKVTVEYGAHGSEAASWTMAPGLIHHNLRSNAPVEIYDGGFCIWCGTLVESGTGGQYAARGLWYQATRVPPMDLDGNLTTNIDGALYGSIITRSELDWSQPVSISNVEWASEPSTDMKLSDLFDRYAAENALRWWVTPNREVRFGADPTTPQWLVPHAVAGRGLTPAEDEFYTHLAGRYLDATTNTYKTAIVGSAEAEGLFGRRTQLVDLSDLKGTDAARAAGVLNGMLLKSGARMGWGEGLELAHGQITTTGGTPAALNQITSLQMVRLAGTLDVSRPHLLRSYTDVVLETVRYTDGSRLISMTPFGYAARNLPDVLSLGVSGG
jgi:hypothetical protein